MVLIEKYPVMIFVLIGPAVRGCIGCFGCKGL
jgi:hypothetical protein